MDFITLAEAAHETSRGLLRLLTDNATAATATTQDGTPLSEHRPLLSPTAEAVLFELSTNFLLYVTMVVIAVMVSRIYFPSMLEPREEPASSLSYDYMNVDAYSSDMDSDEEEEDDDGSRGAGDDDDKAGLSHTEEGRDDGRPRGRRMPRTRSSSFLYDEYADSEAQARRGMYSRLAACAIALNLTFVSWGVLQERMLTRRYPRLTGEYFTYSYALVFTNRLWTVVLSGALLLYFRPRAARSTVLYQYAFPSISNMLSSWCQYEALRYISFPAVTLFKALKLVPVMIMGKLLGNDSYPQYDYMVAILVGVGIAMFMTSTDELTFDFDVYGEQTSAKWTGVMLMVFFLFFDSFTSQWQGRMFNRHPDLSMIELMFATSAFSTVLSLITLIHDDMLWPAFDFMSRHSEIQFHFFAFSLCSTVGQLFIFYTIKNFGAVVLAIILTTRILISIALSVYLYGHVVTSTGFYGLAVVFIAISYRIKRKAETSQLIKWKGMGEQSEKETELVQEWHEHADM